MISVQQVDWTQWLGRWDAIQTAHLPFREQRFIVMLETLEALVEKAHV